MTDPTISDVAQMLNDCSTEPPASCAESWGGQEWFDRRSKAVSALCSSGGKYVLKGPILSDEGDVISRDAYNHNVVGHIGRLLFPDVVPKIAVICVPVDVKESTPEFKYLVPGPVHGMVFLPGLCEGDPGRHDNAERLTKIAALYNLCGIEDPQVRYDGDGLVYSVGNGNAFGRVGEWSGSEWDAARLHGDKTFARGPSQYFTERRVTKVRFEEVAQGLGKLSLAELCRLAKFPPPRNVLYP